MYTTGHRLQRFCGVFGLLAVICAATAIAQDADKVAALKTLHERLSDLKKIVKEDEAVEALTKLDEWDTWARDAKGETRTMYYRSRAIVMCMLGEAARAEDAVAKLQPILSTDRPNVELAYFVASIAGNAPAMEEALRLWKEKAEDKELKAISLRQRRYAKIGKPAPSVTVTTDVNDDVDIGERNGEPMLIDFWSMRSKPEESHTAAMRALYAEFKSRDSGLVFLGVNSDGPAKLKEAKSFVVEKKWDWPQHYEEKAADAPLTAKGFAAGQPPWTVIIDMHGKIRTVGDPSEPAFIYAVRAVVAESSAKVDFVKPIPIGGEKPEKKEEKKEAKKDEKKADGKTDTTDKKPPEKKEEVKGKGDLPSNPDAEGKLKQARLYLKTGKKTDAKRILNEIVKEFPGTREAREAEEILRNLP